MQPFKGKVSSPRWLFALLFALLFTCGALVYLAGLRHNPPGFHLDESSIAYNAYLISQSGHDEYGKSWPLYFRAFGDYKNPVQVYLLAAVFRFTGPSIAAARYLSALAGVLAAVLLALLAQRVSGRASIGLFVLVMALLTPWLFELSRVVMEVALYPVAVAGFLLAVHPASQRPRWTPVNILFLAIILAAVTYTYSIGRLFGPLLAAGLLIFITRENWKGIAVTWLAYVCTLVPMLVFQRQNPAALTARFNIISYVGTQNSAIEILFRFVRQYLANINPWRMFIDETSNVSEIIHIPGAQPMLFVTGLLVIASFVCLVRSRLANRWWLFVIYGLMISIVPASLTNERFHMLRLAAVPVFLLTLTIPALEWIAAQNARAGRLAWLFLLGVTLAQGAWFQYQYRAQGHSARREHLFDADYTGKILPAALANSSGRIYCTDAPAIPGYIQAFWFGTRLKIPLDRFVVLPPDQAAPENATVISTEDINPRAGVLAYSEPYTAFIAQGPPRIFSALPQTECRAQLSVFDPPLELRAGQEFTLHVTVKNLSNTRWLARERSFSPLQLSAGNHWLDEAGNVLVNDNGRGALPHDLSPGETAAVAFRINAPRRAGKYQLEVDMLQEGVSWFGPRGSQTWRGALSVK